MPSEVLGQGKVLGGTIWGASAALVEIQVDVRGGLPVLEIVGLPDRAVSEAARRVRTAMGNSGFKLPPRRIVVNLAPADLPKRGVALDLPIAVAIGQALGQLPRPRAGDVAYWGQVSLDGTIRGAPGLLPFALAVRDAGVGLLVVPLADLPEAGLAGVKIRAVSSLAQLRAAETSSVNRPMATALRSANLSPGAVYGNAESNACLNAIVGLRGPLRCLEIAAAGEHHCIFLGPIGVGKSLLARALHALLPTPSGPEVLELACIASIAQAEPLSGEPGVITRPLRSPAPGTGLRAMLGGGSPPKLGEVSLAHRGMLILDELGHFRSEVLLELAGVLSRGVSQISALGRGVQLPAGFLLAATSNFCACGKAGTTGGHCSCTSQTLRAFRRRLSQTLLDRIDMHVEVAGPEVAELEEAFGSRLMVSGQVPGFAAEVSQARNRIAAARSVQSLRYGEGVNGSVADSAFRAAAEVSFAAARLAARAGEELGLSARAVVKVLRVARTIADLADSESVVQDHVAEALSYRARPWGPT